MKKITLVLSFLLAAGLVYAQDPPSQPMPEKAPPAVKSEKTQKVEAEVVSVDAAAKTLTFKSSPSDQPQTAPVEGKAVTALKDVMTGQKYTLYCKKDTSGNVQSIVDIKKPATKPEGN
jgi:protein-disulfide isomerase